MITALIVVLAVIVVTAVLLVSTSIRVLREYERGVVFRLGRAVPSRGPGLVVLMPILDRMVRVSLRTITLQVPAQEIITRDNIPARVTAVTYYRIVDAAKSVLEIENVTSATSQVAQTTLRSVLGKVDLDSLLSDRETLNEHLQTHHRRPDRALGGQGHRGRDQGRRDPRADAARDRAPSGSRARAPRQDHRRRGRVPGRSAAERRGRGDQPEPGDDPAALPADVDRGVGQPELDDRLPAADRRPAAA